MVQKYNFDTLRACNKIIIYGAGSAGTLFLKSLNLLGFDKKAVYVWDVNYSEIKERCGFIVSKPNFEYSELNKEIPVVIAINVHFNSKLAEEIYQGFIAAGYENIVAYSEITTFNEEIEIDKFINNAYLDCSYEESMDFSELKPLIKPIAFYLPQFHEIFENNEWWGKGFTEWTNTSKARPKFKGHYQPREPNNDLGYYDLSDPSVIKKQAIIAKRHGIYGWNIYYYWFSGKKLLTKPIDLLLENKDIDINFCLTWCNHTWSKSWVGNHNEELIKCEYGEDDPEKFIDDIKIYMLDERYIRIKGKPLLSILLTHKISGIKDMIRRWRERAIEIGIGDISIFSIIHPFTLSNLKLHEYFDGEVEFSPCKYAINAIKLVDRDNISSSNYVYRYEDCFENYKRIIEKSDHNAYLSCMCGWDNTPRYDQRYRIMDLEFSKKHFYDMVNYITKEAVAYKKEYIFVFAWNEWAEGAYLEPDKRFGYTMLNTFSKAICGLPLKYETYKNPLILES